MTASLIARLFAILALGAAATVAPAQVPDDVAAGYDALLEANVTDAGLVRYTDLRDDHAALDAYVAALADVELDNLGDDEKLATLINAYNAFFLSMAIEQYPFDNVLDDLDRPFEAERFKLAGQTISLNGLENDLIRGTFDEPRIHWAVNCGAISCPPLRAEAYVGERLDAQLADQESRTLGDPKFVRVDGDVLRVTRLFEWYGDDFREAAGSVAAYVAERVPAAARLGGQPTVEFLDYDWTLNDAGAEGRS